MAQEASQSNFRRGVTTLVLLAMLKKEDMYGFQLVQQIADVSDGKIVTQEGSLYPILYKLLDSGYISDRRVQVGKRLTRVYYHLEPLGEDYLRALVREYRETSRGVQMILEVSEL